jgi:hypothetical protein
MRSPKPCAPPAASACESRWRRAVLACIYEPRRLDRASRRGVTCRGLHICWCAAHSPNIASAGRDEVYGPRTDGNCAGSVGSPGFIGGRARRISGGIYTFSSEPSNPFWHPPARLVPTRVAAGSGSPAQSCWIQARVEIPGREPYDAGISQPLDAAVLVTLGLDGRNWDVKPGKTFAVRVDSADPQKVLIDFSRPTPQVS